ncbi:MAG: reverse transcriptase family protein [Planctomycetota bacterium]|nr:reverse transcriptase family protein [Planctomycetota bacterium]
MSHLATPSLPRPPAGVLALADSAEHRYRVYPLVSGSKRRWIEAPDRELKAAQRWLLDQWFYQLAPTDAAHGFVPGRSIVSNASQHVGCAWVVTADLRNFFPSIGTGRIAQVLSEFEQPSDVTAAVVGLVTRRRRLPQGAPTSPQLANLVARRLDLRLLGWARRRGWSYTRYADDLTFSGAGKPRPLLGAVERIVRDEGFTLAPGKTHVMPHHQRQVVTGMVVNERVALPKPHRRLLRAMLHRLETMGVDKVDPRQLQVVQGHLALAHFVDPARFQAECRALATLLRGTSPPPATTHSTFAPAVANT